MVFLDEGDMSAVDFTILWSSGMLHQLPRSIHCNDDKNPTMLNHDKTICQLINNACDRYIVPVITATLDVSLVAYL